MEILFFFCLAWACVVLQHFVLAQLFARHFVFLLLLAGTQSIPVPKLTRQLPADDMAIVRDRKVIAREYQPDIVLTPAPITLAVLLCNTNTERQRKKTMLLPLKNHLIILAQIPAQMLPHES